MCRLPDEVIETGAIVRGKTIAELAKQIDVPAEALEQTVQRFNEFAAMGQDPDFGRGQSAYNICLGDPGYKPNAALGPFSFGITGKAKFQNKDFQARSMPAKLTLTLPFTLKVEPVDLKLPQGGKAKWKITAIRKAGYQGPIEKSLLVSTNDPQTRALLLRVQVDLQPLIEVLPGLELQFLLPPGEGQPTANAAVR